MSLVDIEKNDVDISKLFAYKKKVTLLVPGTTDEIELYIRVLGDADNNRARVHALRTSAELRAKLKNKRWKDRPAYIPITSSMRKSELIDHILALILQELTLEAINEVTVQTPKELDGDASLEEQEAYQKEIDGYTERFNTAVAEQVNVKLEELAKELNKQTKEILKERYESIVINNHAQAEFSRAFLEIATYFATYTEETCTKKAFKSFEDFQNTPKHLKETLISEYEDLLIGGASLKKLPGVTQ